MKEYVDLQARVKLADADVTDFFAYSKGGRQGGIETPEPFNLMMEATFADVVKDWKTKRYGFSLNDKDFVSHAVWADNWLVPHNQNC